MYRQIHLRYTVSYCLGTLMYSQIQPMYTDVEPDTAHVHLFAAKYSSGTLMYSQIQPRYTGVEQDTAQVH